MRDREILDALAHRHANPRNGDSRAWVFVEEVRVGTGFRMVAGDRAEDPIRMGQEQRIDAFAMHTWPSKKYRRVAYEVKVSRSDLRRELERPYKCAAALELSNQFYLVAPRKVLELDEDLPPEWGTMEYRDGHLRVVRKAPIRNTPLPPYTFMLSVARNLQQTLEAA